ncbi:alanine racemase [Algoriphagus boritolerans DSM 17298 = JCM 18970]|uniref:Alanine racemase n=1 Tax=Algoriphagus boritolerans DSM 17298 = JCM 18970 TaxID=1120964 RepID=A0A1H5YEI5_9BACT|nr:alanine racemase [Algoriphagus boritolerans DSM 17298 = JCM 18970]
MDNKLHLDLKGLCTHFAGAESAQNHTRILSQLEQFERFSRFFKENDLEFERLHTACSAATLLFPETHMDLVRIGIAGYGFWPTQETFELIKNQLPPENRNPLKRLLTWKTQIMSLKKVKSGEFVGYGKSFEASQDMTLAIIPVGYSHGYGRNLSNQGKVLISGSFCPVVGTVNMNAVAVDISHLKLAKSGDEVILIGTQGKNEITVGSFAETSDLVNYEMLTRLPFQIPRKIVDLSLCSSR